MGEVEKVGIWAKLRSRGNALCTQMSMSEHGVFLLSEAQCNISNSV